MDPNASIRELVERFVQESPLNRHADGSGPYFDQPLVGFASAEDPLFEEFKEIIGDFHLTPRELFEDSFGKGSFPGGTVICWILPIPEETRLTNRLQNQLPSARWAHTRESGEQFNAELRRHVVSALGREGHRAVAPLLSPRCKTLNDERVGFASTWSERHAAFAAGLGTFSLSDALITECGVAHRIGSVITDLVLQPSARPYEHFRANCLFFREHTCGACIDRCPVGALSEGGHDKRRCLKHVYRTVLEAVGERYAVSEAGCGLCQTEVPCESRIPRGRVSKK